MKKLTLLLITLFVAVGCTPKKSSVKANVATISGVTVGTQCTNFNSNSNIGTIYDQAGSFDFENRVKGLLSATTNPAEIGNISPNQADTSTGVRFTGRVKLDANGNVVGAQSKITITVYDSVLLYDPTAKPIVIDLDPAAGKGVQITGQFETSSGNGFISIRDNFGEIRFQGMIDAQRFSGTVSFANSVNVMGGQPASGNLGQFYIQRCSFFQ